MDKKKHSKTPSVAGEFVSKSYSIRSKNLKNFLNLYYWTHIQERKKPKLKQRRKPKIRPGLRFIQAKLGCCKATAFDYLRAIQITHDLLLKTEMEKRGIPVKINMDSYEKLRKKNSRSFEHVVEILDIKRQDQRKRQEVKECLNAVADDIECCSGVFTPKQCARIIREFASLLY